MKKPISFLLKYILYIACIALVINFCFFSRAKAGLFMGAEFVITDFPTVVGVFGLTAISGIVCGYTKVFIDVLKCPFGVSKTVHTSKELHSFWVAKYIAVVCSSVIVFFSYIMQDIYNLNSDNLYNEIIEHFHHRADAVFLPLIYGAVFCLLLLPFYAESKRNVE